MPVAKLTPISEKKGAESPYKSLQSIGDMIIEFHSIKCQDMLDMYLLFGCFSAQIGRESCSDSIQKIVNEQSSSLMAETEKARISNGRLLCYLSSL